MEIEAGTDNKDVSCEVEGEGREGVPRKLCAWLPES